MSNTSNFRAAMRQARTQALVGPNVIANALPFLGGGLVLTALGTFGGLRVLQFNPSLFFPTFIGAIVLQLILFFVASSVAQKGNNSVALPLLATYSLLTGYTLTGIVAQALTVVGIQAIAIAALGCGVTFIVGRQIGSNLSEKDGMALSKTVSLGIIALLVVLVLQLLFSFFGIFTFQSPLLEIGISGLGVVLFVGASVVDFFILPRTYQDDQYLPAALSMYLTYINLFIFILRLIIAFNRD